MRGKRVLLCVLCCGMYLYAQRGYAAPALSSVELLTVDGVYQNTDVVINGRSPLFAWDFTFDAGTRQNQVSLQVGTAVNTSDMWSHQETTSLKSKAYGGSALTAGVTYYWRIQVADNAIPPASSAWERGGTFFTTLSAVSATEGTIVLFVDWNNPFNPTKEQVTKIRYGVTDGNRQVSVRIFTINGELVDTLASHLAINKALYTGTWDGTNARGRLVGSGTYIVCLETDTNNAKTVRVVVVK